MRKGPPHQPSYWWPWWPCLSHQQWPWHWWGRYRRRLVHFSSQSPQWNWYHCFSTVCFPKYVNEMAIRSSRSPSVTQTFGFWFMGLVVEPEVDRKQTKMRKWTTSRNFVFAFARYEWTLTGTLSTAQQDTGRQRGANSYICCIVSIVTYPLTHPLICNS